MALISVTGVRERADVLVHVTDTRANADLFVFKAQSRDMARGQDEVWYEVDVVAIADVSIMLVDSIRAADLVVYFVDSRDLAGWRRSHDLDGKLITRSG